MTIPRWDEPILMLKLAVFGTFRPPQAPGWPAWGIRACRSAPSGQKLAPGADVVNVRVAVFLQQQFRHPAARSAGAADADGGRFGDFAQPAAQFLQGEVQRAGGVAADIFGGAAYVNQGGAA